MEAHTEPREVDWRWTEEELERLEAQSRREREEEEARKSEAFLAYEEWASRG